MHPAIIKMRQQRITLKQWAATRGFSAPYCSMVISGKRGGLEFGKAREIIEALRVGGFWTENKSEEKK